MKENIETLISKTAIQKRISEIAEDISQDYAGESLELICVLKGGVYGRFGKTHQDTCYNEFYGRFQLWQWNRK